MPLKIVKAGVLDTVRDGGRFGFSHLGINPGGMMDTFAGKMANILAGNSMEKAVIEMHYPAPQILFTEDALISITGGDFTPEINNKPAPAWHPVLVRKNATLTFSGCRWGSRAYLAVQGSIYVEKWLNSSSTNLKAGAGGWRGRRLEKGDVLSFGYSELDYTRAWKSGGDFQVLPWAPDVKSIYHPGEMLFIEGKEWPLLDEPSKKAFLTQSFLIRNESDRMGYRLQGSPINTKKPVSIVSAPVTFGTIQLLRSGQLVLLMADHQTIGGYPRVGDVISAHLPRLAQHSSNQRISFRNTTWEEAEHLLTAQCKELHNLEALCNDHLKDFIWRK